MGRHIGKQVHCTILVIASPKQKKKVRKAGGVWIWQLICLFDRTNSKTAIKIESQMQAIYKN